jgi:UV excision repair protein RAD23
MKVTCKTLQGAAFTVEAEPSETVAQLKQKIQAANPSLVAEHAVTVFQGKVLQDDADLTSSGVSETGFVVVMIKKPAAGACALARRLARRRPLLAQASRAAPAASRAAPAAARRRDVACLCCGARAREAASRGAPASRSLANPSCSCGAAFAF